MNSFFSWQISIFCLLLVLERANGSETVSPALVAVRLRTFPVAFYDTFSLLSMLLRSFLLTTVAYYELSLNYSN